MTSLRANFRETAIVPAITELLRVAYSYGTRRPFNAVAPLNEASLQTSCATFAGSDPNRTVTEASMVEASFDIGFPRARARGAELEAYGSRNFLTEFARVMRPKPSF
jgi:hypothetical protein